MTGWASLLRVCGAGLVAIAGIWQAGRARHAGGMTANVVAVLCLVVAGWVGGVPQALVFGVLASGLGLGLVFQPRAAAVLMGMTALAAGRLAFCRLFAGVSGTGLSQIGPVGYGLGWGLLILALAVAVLVWPRAGRLRGSVVGYVAASLAMGWAALMVPDQGMWLLLVPGALLCVISDMALALERCAMGHAHPARDHLVRWVWIAGWSGQALLTAVFCMTG